MNDTQSLHLSWHKCCIEDPIPIRLLFPWAATSYNLLISPPPYCSPPPCSYFIIKNPKQVGLTLTIPCMNVNTGQQDSRTACTAGWLSGLHKPCSLHSVRFRSLGPP